MTACPGLRLLAAGVLLVGCGTPVTNGGDAALDGAVADRVSVDANGMDVARDDGSGPDTSVLDAPTTDVPVNTDTPVGTDMPTVTDSGVASEWLRVVGNH